MKIINISVQEWDDLVISTYGRPYSFQQQDGCKERGIEIGNKNKGVLHESF